MAKLYFKYGAMGSSKTAQALITRFNYEERGIKTLLLKPAVDTRDGVETVSSRIGLSAEAVVVGADCDIFELYTSKYLDCKAVIVDECQFLNPEQIDQLGLVSMEYDVPCICFGLSTDFTTHLFPASKRLFEIAESVTEIKSVCKCGAKATVNARFDDKGNILFSGDTVCLGGNERYTAMCRRCWLRKKAEQESGKIDF